MCPARWARLPLTFDTELLRHDLGKVNPEEWLPHYNRTDYDGEWTGVALRSASGSAAELFTNPNDSAFRDTPILDRCPYFRETISKFQCPLKAVRLLRLSPGSRILEHTDYGLKYIDGDLRFHVPIETNPDTQFVVDGRRLTLLAGESWYIDFSLPHRIHNRGATPRVHLVLDGTVNDWAHNLISAAEQPTGEAPQPDSDFPRFRQLVYNDPGLQQQLLQVSDPESFFELAARLGSQRGFSFTAADVAVAHRAGKRAWIERALDF
jgi:hypothetical protein